MIENKEVKIAKQLDEVMVLVEQLRETIKNKGDYSALLPALIDAVSNVDEIPVEFKTDMFACIDTVLLSATKIAKLFVVKAE